MIENFRLPIDENWEKPDKTHDGGVSTGIGYTIAWQRGPLKEAGRNGAFLIEVIASCASQLNYYQSGAYACQENAEALNHLHEALIVLSQRRDRRATEGKLGTHLV